MQRSNDDYSSKIRINRERVPGAWNWLVDWCSVDAPGTVDDIGKNSMFGIGLVRDTIAGQS